MMFQAGSFCSNTLKDNNMNEESPLKARISPFNLEQSHISPLKSKFMGSESNDHIFNEHMGPMKLEVKASRKKLSFGMEEEMNQEIMADTGKLSTTESTEELVLFQERLSQGSIKSCPKMPKHKVTFTFSQPDEDKDVSQTQLEPMGYPMIRVSRAFSQPYYQAPNDHSYLNSFANARNVLHSNQPSPTKEGVSFIHRIQSSPTEEATTEDSDVLDLDCTMQSNGQNSDQNSEVDGFSNRCTSLPTLEGSGSPWPHTISRATMKDLLDKGDDINLIVVDCRYPYEYEGGHIKGALNVTSPGLLQKIFFTNKNMILDKDYVKCLKEDLHGTLNRLDLDHANFKAQNPCQPIIVFHCEFSQRRGPRAFRALRNMDRTFNKWPALNYPEIYILEGGYEKFHAEYPEYCTLNGGYVPMLDERYRKEYYIAHDFEKKHWKKTNCFSLGLTKAKSSHPYQSYNDLE